jgi:hypothetical protein
LRDDATTVTTLTADAEAQLARMDPDAAEVLTHEHFVAQLLALTRALPLEQMNAYVERLLNPENPFHGVIGTAARESVATERQAP